MAAFAGAAPRTCAISINLFDGRRMPFEAAADVLFTVIDGDQRQVFRDYRRAGTLEIEGLPYYGNYCDSYTVIAYASGYDQAGFTPVKVAPNAPQPVQLMLLGKNAAFNFAGASWETIQAQRPTLARVLAGGAATPEAARDRYRDLMERGPVLACLLNITTAMEQIHLPSGTPLDYFQELIWDGAMAQDRFFGYADAKLIDQTRQAWHQGLFAPEAASFLFHPGATSSFKQVQFGEANVQLTFHEDDRRTINGLDCVKVEPDIDYYKDEGAHTIMEVIPNRATGGLTDPRQVYLLRWMAGLRAGQPGFDPLYTIV